jgi:hypothetical protein
MLDDFNGNNQIKLTRNVGLITEVAIKIHAIYL